MSSLISFNGGKNPLMKYSILKIGKNNISERLNSVRNQNNISGLSSARNGINQMKGQKQQLRTADPKFAIRRKLTHKSESRYTPVTSLRASKAVPQNSRPKGGKRQILNVDFSTIDDNH